MINIMLILIVIQCIINIIGFYIGYRHLTNFTANIRVYINQLENRIYDDWEQKKLSKFINSDGLYTNKKGGTK